MGNFCQFLYDFIMLLLLLLCIKPQHIYVVVVVVVVYFYWSFVAISSNNRALLVKSDLKTYCEANKFLYIGLLVLFMETKDSIYGVFCFYL